MLNSVQSNQARNCPLKVCLNQVTYYYIMLNKEGFTMTLDRKTYTGLAFILMGLALFVFSCSGGGAPTTDQQTPTGANLGGSPATTSAFGIPDGITGTVSDGETLFADNCAVCHGSSLGPKTFDQIKAALASVSAMSSLSLTDQEIANITMYLNRDSIPPATDPPVSDPPPSTDPPPATDPGGTATDTTTGYGIPTGLTGSITAGETIWSGTCNACHSSMSPKTYQQVEGALAGVGAMQGLNLTEQQVADITAYLNRAAIQGEPVTGVGSGDDDGDDDSSMGSDDDEDDGGGEGIDDGSDDGSSGGDDEGVDDGSGDGSSGGDDEGVGDGSDDGSSGGDDSGVGSGDDEGEGDSGSGDDGGEEEDD